jgi:hypothetical protein
MSRTTRLVLIGITTFIVCLAAFAPASLVRYLLRDAAPLTLAGEAGSIWRGSGNLAFGGTPLGRITWSFAPSTLLSGRLGFDFDIDDVRLQLSGRATASPSTARAEVAGSIDMSMLSATLARYDIQIPGTLTVEHLDIAAAYGARLPQLHGNVKWSGGKVAYRLSGRNHRIELPPLVGFLDSATGEPEMTVYQIDAKMPLLLARVTQDGLATIGITKQFTKLLGEPWPGGEPDHAVVLEVGEKLF